MDHAASSDAASAYDSSDDVGGGEVEAPASWLVGRLVKVSYEAGCGFIRAAGGALVYFSLADVAPASAGLRPSVRVRYQAARTGGPRALAVSVA